MSEEPKKRMTTRAKIFLFIGFSWNLLGDVYLLKWTWGAIMLEHFVLGIVVIAVLAFQDSKNSN
jgi:hypothetical protein